MRLIEHALLIAYNFHTGQVRKYSGLPYIVHPMEVASIVRHLPEAGEEEIAAALLHDVIEDCHESCLQYIERDMTLRVISLVKELTNPSKGSKAPRAERKAMDHEHIKAGCQWARKIKLVDRTCNLRDMAGVEDTFIKLYVEESIALLQALKGTDPTLEAELESCILSLSFQLSDAVKIG